MKNYLKFICSIGLVFLLMLSLCFTSFASVQSLMIRTNSNAMATFNLPRSSIASITNTVEWDFTYKPFVRFTTRHNDTGGTVYHWITPEEDADGLWIEWTAPKNYSITLMNVYFVLDGKYINSPPIGTYDTQIDLSSYFSHDITGMRLLSQRVTDNATTEESVVNLPIQEVSGDIYTGVFNLTISNGLDRAGFGLTYDRSSNVVDIAYLVKVNFRQAPKSDNNISFVDSSASDSDIEANYQNSVSSSLSDLSSSVDDLGEGISGVTEAIQNLQGAMEPHYSNVLTQLHHITEQLHAFYDQVYNNIHLVELDILQGILAAIENMDLEVNVELGGLKQTIERVSSEIQTNDNKLAAEQIANDEANTEEVKDAVKEHGNFIIDGLKGLFIPSDEFFKAYFDDLYAYFSDRFGFLSFPIDLVIRIADLFLTSEKVDAVLTLPSFEISGYKVWEDYSFNFTEFLETSFPFLISAIQTVTSIGLIMAFVNLCQDKWNEVMRS